MREWLIDEGSMLRNTKSQLLRDGDKPQAIPSYVKYAYPNLKQEERRQAQFRKFLWK
jgi:hypothetical protein